MRYPSLLIAIVALMIIGCGGNQSAYKTLGTIAHTVDTAMTVAADAHVAGELTEKEWTEVGVHHERYRLAFQSAITGARLNTKALAPADVIKLSGELTALITNLTTKEAQ